jgi:uncharacterized membrane protein YbhN (UPF0104 family)
MKKIFKTAAFTAIILLIAYYYALEFRSNWTELTKFRLAIKARYLVASFSLCLLAYLLETYIWKVCINKHSGRSELTLRKSIAIVNTSGLFKYLPGRIWIYTAQLVWLKKYGISKAVIFYANLICVLGSVIVSFYFGLLYLALYKNIMGGTAVALSFIALILFNIVYIAWNSALMNKFIAVINQVFRKDIPPLTSSRSLLLFIQLVYACSWLLTGLSGYLLAQGIGLPIAVTGIFALLASMSLAWVAGYFVVIAPGGLGIREGVMLVMLNNIVSVETALIFPLVSRVMYLIAEALLGLTALFLGMKYNIFSSKERATN